MSSPAEVIHQYLADAGLTDLSADWPGYISHMPNKPDQAVCVYDESGRDDGRLMIGTKIDHPGVQIIVRSEVYSTGWEKISAIALSLDNQARTVVAIESSPTYVLDNVSRRGTIHHMGLKDEEPVRHYFSVNLTVTLREQD